MNRESSRSHCVLICSIRSRKTENGLVNTLSSRLNLVDLAGSEAQKASGASGERLREAANINKSLSILGRVINSLSQQQKNGARVIQHVPYRDSKLTFLLQVRLLIPLALTVEVLVTAILAATCMLKAPSMSHI
jgi:kinesin family member 15